MFRLAVETAANKSRTQRDITRYRDSGSKCPGHVLMKEE